MHTDEGDAYLQFGLPTEEPQRSTEPGVLFYTKVKSDGSDGKRIKRCQRTLLTSVPVTGQVLKSSLDKTQQQTPQT